MQVKDIPIDFKLVSSMKSYSSQNRVPNVIISSLETYHVYLKYFISSSFYNILFIKPVQVAFFLNALFLFLY